MVPIVRDVRELDIFGKQKLRSWYGIRSAMLIPVRGRAIDVVSSSVLLANFSFHLLGFVLDSLSCLHKMGFLFLGCVNA